MRPGVHAQVRAVHAIHDVHGVHAQLGVHLLGAGAGAPPGHQPGLLPPDLLPPAPGPPQPQR